jgi:VIT1/CCC1 family predicted Fe2+/Mn2+ transporter
MLRYSVLYEQIRQAMEHIIGPYVSVSQNSQALTAELIDHSQYLNGSPIISTIHKKIV